ncbi:hypothetical protein ACQ4LE_010415 [Meloidogyne hapla]
MSEPDIYLNTLIITLIQQFISILGIIFNLSIVWITFKDKSLQTSYGYLLAFNSLYDALNESSTFLPTILVLLQTKITLLICFYVSFLQTVFCSCSSYFCMFLISIDRLIGLAFPIL